MIELGKKNRLLAVRTEDHGFYLDGEDHGHILLPNRYVPDNFTVGDEIDVFIYFDSEDRIVATTEEPLAVVGEFAFLKVVATTKFGAFADWGVMKDLLIPFREQRMELKEEDWVLVYIYLDKESKRIVGSTKIDRYLGNVPPEYTIGDSVECLVYNKIDIGYLAIVDNKFPGMLYSNEVFTKINRGEKITAYVKNIREDDKIDLSITPIGYDKISDMAQSILDKLKEKNGFIPLGDKSPVERIYDEFKMSKKNFKKAIGDLYKQKLIIIDKNSIELINK